MLQLRSVACFLVATGLLWNCGGTANTTTGGVGTGPLGQQPAANPNQPGSNPQQPATNPNQPPSDPNQPSGSSQPPPGSGGLDCGAVCSAIGAAGCDQITGQCSGRCLATQFACAAQIRAIVNCVGGSACVNSDFSDACQPTYDTYLSCEATVIGGGGSAGNGAGGNGAGGNGGDGAGGGPPPPPGGAGGDTGTSCTLTGDSCLGCATLCLYCACSGTPPADCGC
jgi:hypothetical protein